MFSEDQVFSDRPVKLPAACEAMLREYRDRKKDPNSTRVDWAAWDRENCRWNRGTATLRGPLELRKRQFKAFRQAIEKAFPKPIYSTTVTTR